MTTATQANTFQMLGATWTITPMANYIRIETEEIFTLNRVDYRRGSMVLEQSVDDGEWYASNDVYQPYMTRADGSMKDVNFKTRVRLRQMLAQMGREWARRHPEQIAISVSAKRAEISTRCTEGIKMLEDEIVRLREVSFKSQIVAPHKLSEVSSESYPKV